jgi:hypothetical protein
VAVRDAAGKLVMESVIETKATRVREFIRGLHGSLWGHLRRRDQCGLIVRTAEARVGRSSAIRGASPAARGNKSDRVDARKLSDLLRAGLLSPVYHEGNSARPPREIDLSIPHRHGPDIPT